MTAEEARHLSNSQDNVLAGNQYSTIIDTIKASATQGEFAAHVTFSNSIVGRVIHRLKRDGYSVLTPTPKTISITWQ